MPSVLTIGNYDGVHRGHRAILDHARRIADQRGADVRVLTFSPHPAALLRPGSEPPSILPLEQRIDRLRRAGADDVQILHATPELLRTEADEFIEEIAQKHDPLAFVEGEGFRFGKARRGDLDTLARLGERLGFDVHVQPPLTLRLTSPLEVRVSSTLVRRLVGHGRVFDAAAALGEPFTLTATIVRGEQRGRTLGVPTVNLDPDALNGFIVPADGVYAGYAELLHEPDHPHPADAQSPTDPPPRFPAAISVGVKPTFGRDVLTVEAHLLGYDDASQGRELYGRTVRLGFARWLRDQYAFPGVEALRDQLRRDIRRTQSLADADRLTVPHTVSA